MPDWQHAGKNTSPPRSLSTWSAPAQAPVAKPAPAEAPLRTGVETNLWISVSEWCSEREYPAPLRLAKTATPSFAVQTTRGNFIFRPGSQRAYWNGVELALGFAPVLVKEQPFLHSLDMKKTLLPLVENAAIGPGTQPVIVLDPGHGGADCGTPSVLGGACEKDYALDWAKRTKALLTAQGWKVLLTRETDVEMALSNRVHFADLHQADLFVSLHFNSAPGDQSQEGLETYCLSPAGMPSHLTRGYADDLRATFPNNAFDEENLRLAEQVHRALLQVNENRDRGVRRARFLGVLRSQQRPAILVEGGYLSNPREARLIATSAYRQKLAEAVARSFGSRQVDDSQRADNKNTASSN